MQGIRRLRAMLDIHGHPAPEIPDADCDVRLSPEMAMEIAKALEDAGRGKVWTHEARLLEIAKALKGEA